MTILYKLTTRSRPHNAYTVIRSIVDLQSNQDYEILISVDHDDPTARALIEKVVQVKGNWMFKAGTCLGKIGSINRDVDAVKNWDILVNVSDDTVFTQHGFDQIIRDQFQDFKGVVHFPDGNRKDLLTMSIMHREYYEKDNYIYFPMYKNLWCDNEAMEVAKIRGQYKFVDLQIFEHRHPAYNKGENDEQYKKTEGTFAQDQELFKSRQLINFGL